MEHRTSPVKLSGSWFMPNLAGPPDYSGGRPLEDSPEALEVGPGRTCLGHQTSPVPPTGKSGASLWKPVQGL
jgi:hypothetical protein